MSKSVIFNFRGKYVAADVAAITTNVEAAIRGLGLTAESGVEGRLEALGRVTLEVTNVPPELQEPVRKTVSTLLVESHGAVFSEE